MATSYKTDQKERDEAAASARRRLHFGIAGFGALRRGAAKRDAAKKARAQASLSAARHAS